ncbi:hypothetical protein PENSUB_5951 [Penicillium subrubescens]|uniref:Uncharacterized protein n=1 Tax=Penicillium subrubescens TaxID=1316194 RepID=A0A1Q5U4G0_9EURO|nr:hypothetical protein PENSUB_5951 [Penicillium subrubescens]
MYQAHVQPSVHVYADYHLSAKLLEIYERATVRTCICNPSYTDRGTGQEMTEAPASGCIFKFRRLCVAHGVPQSGPTIAFFKRWTRTPEKFQLCRSRVQKWISDGKTRHVWAKWKEARARDFTGIKDLETIWVPKWSGLEGVLNVVDQDTLTHGSVDGEINVWTFCPNETHPWVREVLAWTTSGPESCFGGVWRTAGLASDKSLLSFN